jgi:hypothetical protein
MHRAALQRERLLIVRRDASVQTGSQGCFSALAKNPARFRLVGRAFYGHFRVIPGAGRSLSFSATTGDHNPYGFILS